MIRRAVPADIPAIQELMRASMHALSAGFYDEQQTASSVEWVARIDRQIIEDGTYFVVVEDDRIIACGGWSARRKLFTGTHAQSEATGWLDPATEPAHIRAMFVHPAHARRGLGRLILETSEEDARRAGFTRFDLMATLPGVPLYRACGYEVVEETELELPDGVRIGGVRMER